MFRKNENEKETERIKEFSKDLIEISKAGLIEREYGEEEYLLIKKEIDWDKSLCLQAFCPFTKDKIKKISKKLKKIKKVIDKVWKSWYTNIVVARERQRPLKTEQDEPMCRAL